MRTLFITIAYISFALTTFGQTKADSILTNKAEAKNNSHKQNDFGIKANGGISSISDLSQIINATIDKNYFVLSGQVGLFYVHHLNDKFTISDELLFMQIEGKEFLETPETNNVGIPTSLYGTLNLWRDISYIGIPVYFGYNFKNLNVNLGLQVNLTLTSNGGGNGEFPYNGSTITFNEPSGKLNIKGYDYGSRAGLILKLSDKFSIDANYYYGISNIVTTTALPGLKWEVQQMAMGLRYRFISFGGNNNTSVK